MSLMFQTLRNVSVNDGDDATAAIQAACDRGGTVFLGSGSFKIAGTITITQPVILHGCGGDWTFTGQAPTTLFSPSAGNDIIHIESHNVAIRDLYLQGRGDRAVPGGGRGVVVGESFVSITPGIGAPVNVELQGLSIASHEIGVDIVSGGSWRLTDCKVSCLDGVRISNTWNVDHGDGVVTRGEYAANAETGAAFRWISGGGLRMLSPKILTCNWGLDIDWRSGLSGGPMILGLHSEGPVTGHIRVRGDTNVSELSGFKVKDSRLNGGQWGILFDDTAWVTDVDIGGTTFVNQRDNSPVRIGANVDGYLVQGNVIDTRGTPAAAIVEAVGAQNGIVANNQVRN